MLLELLTVLGVILAMAVVTVFLPGWLMTGSARESALGTLELIGTNLVVLLPAAIVAVVWAIVAVVWAFMVA